MPSDHPQNENTYFIEAENIAEMARLLNQDRLLTKSMGSLFPEHSDLSTIHDILDIACGPGGWALDVAKTYPHTQVVGIDISQLMTEYARTQALKHRVSNAQFRVMNAFEPLDFPDNSFDLVNARFISPFMSPTAWPQLIQECRRILRPGGVIRLTEPESPISTSLSLSHLWSLFTNAFKRAGQSFSPDGQHFGNAPMLGRFLRDADFRQIEKRAHVTDFSAGMEAHLSTCQDLMVFFKLIQPFLLKWEVTTQEEADVLYHRVLAEIQDDDFCGVWFFLTAYGKKPS